MRMVALCANVEVAELEGVEPCMVEDAGHRIAVVDVELLRLPKMR